MTYNINVKRHRYLVTRVSKVLCGLFLSTTMTPIQAIAQEAGVASTGNQADDGQKLQEIVVTAQRRAENVQNVPIAISAFSGQALKAGGVTSALELGQVDPSLNVNFNQGVAYPFLRGIGNIAAGVIGNESSVAVYVDDFYYTRLFSSVLDLGSIDRVEVLKGPQGTLFGRNASGGAIQMFTRDPDPRSRFDATVGYANYHRVTGRLYASTPITDTLSWNIAAGGSYQRDGWGRSVLNGQREYRGSDWTVRSKLLWEPTDKTRIKLVGFYAHQKDDFGMPHDYVKGTFGGTSNPYSGPADPMIPGYPNPPIILPSLADSGGFYDSRFAFRNVSTIDTYGASLRIDQEASFANFVSITGFKNSRGNTQNQIGFDSPNWLNLPISIVDDQITQEFQIKSKKGSGIEWIVGAFYLNYRAGYDPAKFTGDALNFAVAPGTTQQIYGIQKIDSYSLFGQATVPLGDTTNLTLGLRGTEDRLKGTGSQYLTIPGVGTIDAAANPYTNSKTFKRITWKGAIDHHFSEDLMAYASISRGYKAGTYNTVPLVAPPALPEIVDTYEIGVKSELFDRRVRVNAALFWNQIKDPQVQTVVGSGATASVGLINAQKARTRGVDIGINAVAARGLNLHADVSYLDANYIRFTNGPLYVGGLTPGGPVLSGPTLKDFSGYTLPNSPKWRFDVGANYTLNTSAGRLVGDINAAYSGPYTFFADNALFFPAKTIVNASLDFTPSSAHEITFGVWVKNLTDLKYYSYSEANVFGAGTGGYRGVAAAPRTFGGTITFSID